MNNLRLLDPIFSDNFESALRRFFSPSLFDDETSPVKMRLDVNENDSAYTVKADLPGVLKDDINVRIDGNLVQIEAESKSEHQTRGNGDKVLCRERHYGSISRSFTLGQDVDESQVKAKYADGVLTLDLPKKASTSVMKINIQ